MTACCESGYTCLECGLPTCAEERPSPGEPNVCDDCSGLVVS